MSIIRFSVSGVKDMRYFLEKIYNEHCVLRPLICAKCYLSMEMSEKIAKFRIGMDLLMQLFHSSPQTEALEESWRLHSHQLLDYL